MKYIFTLLLLALTFQSIFSEQEPISQEEAKEKHIKTAKVLNYLFKVNKRSLRKLQDTSGPEETSEPTLPPSEPYVPTPDDEPESGNAAAENHEVPVKKPVAKKTKTTNNKKLGIQISKFHSFKTTTGNGIGPFNFGMLFYFLNRQIVRYIILRLRIHYFSRLRNLEESAESVRTDCSLTNTELSGKTAANGINVNFNCTANSTKDVRNANVTLNTDVPMTLVNDDGTSEPLDFSNVNFNGNAATESASIQQNTKEIDPNFEEAYLKDTTFDWSGTILVLKGTLDTTTPALTRRLTVQAGDKFTMYWDDNEYPDCELKQESPYHTLNCETSRNPLSTTVQDIHLTSGANDAGNKILNIKMQNGDSSTELITTPTGSGHVYKKSSSGLSGGAIAGIVIACVVVLVAAAIAAIMLRKPSPPVDNTTVVDLKNEAI